MTILKTRDIPKEDIRLPLESILTQITDKTPHKEEDRNILHVIKNLFKSTPENPDFLKLNQLKKELFQERNEYSQLNNLFPIEGNNIVSKLKYLPKSKDRKNNILQGNVYINETQYFSNIPLISWKLYVKNNQPAQQWVQDRIGTKLTPADIFHFQKILDALIEAQNLIKKYRY